MCCQTPRRAALSFHAWLEVACTSAYAFGLCALCELGFVGSGSRNDVATCVWCYGAGVGEGRLGLLMERGVPGASMRVRMHPHVDR